MCEKEEERFFSNKLLARIFYSIPDSLIFFDTQGTIRMVNPAVLKMLDYSKQELLGRQVDMIFNDPQVLRELLAEEGTTECILRRKDGTTVPVSCSGTKIERGGTREGVVCIAQDISERKQAEEKLRRIAAKLKASNRELTDFAYVASHDLQEPLRKVTAFGERLRVKCGDALGERGMNYLDRMQNAAERMQILINDLLQYSRVTTKAQPFAQVNLADVASEVLEDLEVRVAELHATVQVDNLPSLDADKLQMRQLFQNLIGNALKFHRPDVPPQVHICSEKIDGDCGDAFKISIKDNGIGFEAEYAERIFEVFQRLHGRGEYEGTGVGLAICRKIARRHGGDIFAKGDPARGTTFYFTLPAHQADGTAQSAVEEHGENLSLKRE